MTEILHLHNPMKDSYLIQRLHKSESWSIKGKVLDNPFSFGGGLKNGGLTTKALDLLRDIFSFDYMGAAEFEFGAVPAALSFLTDQWVKKNGVSGEINGIYYVCPKPYEEEVKKRIEFFKAKQKYGYDTKSLVLLYESLQPDSFEYVKKNVGWLELDNGYAFFTDKEMFDKFITLLNKFE